MMAPPPDNPGPTLSIQTHHHRTAPARTIGLHQEPPGNRRSGCRHLGLLAGRQRHEQHLGERGPRIACTTSAPSTATVCSHEVTYQGKDSQLRVSDSPTIAQDGDVCGRGSRGPSSQCAQLGEVGETSYRLRWLRRESANLWRRQFDPIHTCIQPLHSGEGALSGLYRPGQAGGLGIAYYLRAFKRYRGLVPLVGNGGRGSGGRGFLLLPSRVPRFRHRGGIGGRHRNTVAATINDPGVAGVIQCWDPLLIPGIFQ